MFISNTYLFHHKTGEMAIARLWRQGCSIVLVGKEEFQCEAYARHILPLVRLTVIFMVVLACAKLKNIYGQQASSLRRDGYGRILEEPQAGHRKHLLHCVSVDKNADSSIKKSNT